MEHNKVEAIRVLYVEDEKALQLSTSLMLERLGYEVACADNGQIGVEQAESWQPDIILMDLRMPVISGDEAIRILRSKPATSKIPIFVLSAFNDAKTREVCKKAGANRFYTKPADIRRIGTVIKQTVDSLAATI